MSKWIVGDHHVERFAAMMGVQAPVAPTGSVAIPLSKNFWSFIDERDLELVSVYKWHCIPNKSNMYAATTVYENGIRLTPKTRLHRYIMAPGAGLVVDHINGNTLDNRRTNLRIVSHLENCHNRREVRGIKRCIVRVAKWRVDLNGKRLGLFDSYDEAVAARRAGERAIWGNMAHVQ